MKKDILLDLIGAIGVTLLHITIFGFQGWRVTALWSTAIFAALVVLDCIGWVWAKMGLPGEGKTIALLLLLAVGAGLPISMMLGLDHHMEMGALVALLFAGLGIGGMILVAILSWRNWHR